MSGAGAAPSAVWDARGGVARAWAFALGRREAHEGGAESASAADGGAGASALRVGVLLASGSYGRVLFCPGEQPTALKLMSRREAGGDASTAAKEQSAGRADDLPSGYQSDSATSSILRELALLLTPRPDRPPVRVLFDAPRTSESSGGGGGGRGGDAVGVLLPYAPLALSSPLWNTYAPTFDAACKALQWEQQHYNRSPLRPSEHVNKALQDTQGELVPLGVVQAVGRQLLTQLAHLHARGVTHADVKPHNVLLIACDGSDSPAARAAAATAAAWRGPPQAAQQRPCAACERAAAWRAADPPRRVGGGRADASAPPPTEPWLRVVLVDGSLSTLCSAPQAARTVTLWWRPPELLGACAHAPPPRSRCSPAPSAYRGSAEHLCECNTAYGPPADVWAWGAMMLAAVTGRPLTTHSTEGAVLRALSTRLPALLRAARAVDAQLGDLLERALTRTPAARATAAELLSDSWWAAPRVGGADDAARTAKWVKRAADACAFEAAKAAHRSAALGAQPAIAAVPYPPTVAVVAAPAAVAAAPCGGSSDSSGGSDSSPGAPPPPTALESPFLVRCALLTVTAASIAAPTLRSYALTLRTSLLAMDVWDAWVASSGHDAATADVRVTVAHLSAAAFLAACVTGRRDTVQLESAWRDVRAALRSFGAFAPDGGPSVDVLRAALAVRAMLPHAASLLAAEPPREAGAATCASATPLHAWAAQLAAAVSRAAARACPAAGDVWTDAQFELLERGVSGHTPRGGAAARVVQALLALAVIRGAVPPTPNAASWPPDATAAAAAAGVAAAGPTSCCGAAANAACYVAAVLQVLVATGAAPEAAALLVQAGEGSAAWLPRGALTAPLTDVLRDVLQLHWSAIVRSAAVGLPCAAPSAPAARGASGDRSPPLSAASFRAVGASAQRRVKPSALARLQPLHAGLAHTARVALLWPTPGPLRSPRCDGSSGAAGVDVAAAAAVPTGPRRGTRPPQPPHQQQQQQQQQQHRHQTRALSTGCAPWLGAQAVLFDAFDDHTDDDSDDSE